MNRSHYRLAAAVSVAAALGVLPTQDGLSQTQQEYIPKAKSETLHQAALPDVDGKEVLIKHFTFPPGFVGEKHFHPGPVFVYVVNGTLTVDSEGEIETFKAGQLFPEPLNRAMVPKNISTSDDLELVVFQIGDVGKPMMIKAE